MSVTKSQVMDRLRSIKGLDGAGNLVDQGLVSEIIIKEDRVYFSITVPIDRAGDLEPLRQAAEKAVAGIDGESARPRRPHRPHWRTDLRYRG